MYINLYCSDLVAGYRQITIYRRVLLGKWRFALLGAHARHCEQFALQLTRHQAWQGKIRHSLPWLVPGLTILCLGGTWLVSMDQPAPGVILISLAVLAGLAGMLVLGSYFISPRRPESPLAQHTAQRQVSPLKQTLFPDLLPAWQKKLSVSLPSPAQVEAEAQTTQKWGLIGEFDLIRRLEKLATADTFLLHSLMPKSHDDMDVVVIGPKGIWYFEVKYINAHFDWRDGVWTITKTDRQTGKTRPEEMNEAIDQQWLRMRDEALRNLNVNLSDLLVHYPALGRIQGGIVLAHPRATYQLQKFPPFQLGTHDDWLADYAEAPRLPEMTLEVVFQIMETMLRKHQSLNPSVSVFSMNRHAASLIQAAERQIQAWIAAVPRS